MRAISLPFVSIDIQYSGDICLMVLGGRAPAVPWLSALDFAQEVWAVDKGLEYCLDAEITPDRLIGDCDSSSVSAWKRAVELGVPVSKFESDKDLTDFQLALDIFSDDRKDKSTGGLFLSGGFGGRFDHLWSVVISFLHRPGKFIPIGMADDEEGMVFLKGPARASASFAKRPESVSLIPFSGECTGVSINGVRWPLDDVMLEYSRPYSISNRLAGGAAVFGLTEGLLGFYWKW